MGRDVLWCEYLYLEYCASLSLIATALRSLFELAPPKERRTPGRGPRCRINQRCVMTNLEGGVKDVSIDAIEQSKHRMFVLGILRFSMPLGDMPVTVDVPFLMAVPHISITPISTLPLQHTHPEHQCT